LAAWPLAVPVVYTPHGVCRSGWALRIEHMLRRRADRVIAVSPSERDFLLVQHLVSADQVVVIPNGIDLEPPSPPSPSLRARLGVPDGAPLVGCVGRLTWQKAPEVYVEACARAHGEIPEAHFVLIGSGPLRRRIEAAVAAAGLAANFHLLRELPNAGAALAELDLYVLPSRFEGGPYTPLEAMRGQTPVLVTDAAGNRDAVAHGVSGLIVAQEDVDALGESIVTVLSDRRLGDSLVRGALDRLPRFDVQDMAAATASVYGELLETPSGRAVPVELGMRRRATLP
jgi:glycosyltransferase involved in cell wall biosynthesis